MQRFVMLGAGDVDEQLALFGVDRRIIVSFDSAVQCNRRQAAADG
ncbi:hypothetical protein [Nitrosomonas sp.]|nr:hypothetical protein [Nitrosomonas sp.]MBV6448112.1 hypothetical protein [Nitrosomonas sp.]